MRNCTGCQETKPLDHFYVKRRKSHKHGYMAVCIECNIADRKRYYSINPDKKVASNRTAQLRKYGITPEQYNELFVAQGGSCAGCGVHQAVYNKRLSVDHDHLTGKVRGLLCQGCNSVLGFSMEQIETLNSLVAYLVKHAPENQTNNIISLMKVST